MNLLVCCTCIVFSCWNPLNKEHGYLLMDTYGVCFCPKLCVLILLHIINISSYSEEESCRKSVSSQGPPWSGCCCSPVAVLRSALSAGGSTSPGLGLLQVCGMNVVGDSCTDTGDQLSSATVAMYCIFSEVFSTVSDSYWTAGVPRCGINMVSIFPV